MLLLIRSTIKEKHTIMQWGTRSLLKPSAVPSRMRKKT